MKLSKGAVALLLVFLIFSCERVDLPGPVVEGLPFELRGTLGGEAFTMGIDQEGFQMTTEARYNENDSIWEFAGRLEAGDGRIGPSLSLGFRPEFTGRSLLQTQVDIFTHTNWRFYSHEGRMITRNPLTLSPNFDENDISIRRVYITGSSESLVNIDGGWQWEAENAESLPICVEYENSKKYPGLFCTHIFQDKNGEVALSNWVINSATDSTAVLEAKIQNPEKEQIFEYDWGEGYQEKRSFSVSTSGTYELKARDQNGLVYSHRKKLLTDPSAATYNTYGNVIPLVSTWGEPRVITEHTQRGSIRFLYVDSNGEEWRLSKHQPSNATFKILDRKNYKRDMAGNPTIALLIELNCLLTNRQGDLLELENLSGWFAIGMPN